MFESPSLHIRFIKFANLNGLICFLRSSRTIVFSSSSCRRVARAHISKSSWPFTATTISNIITIINNTINNNQEEDGKNEENLEICPAAYPLRFRLLQTRGWHVKTRHHQLLMPTSVYVTNQRSTSFSSGRSSIRPTERAATNKHANIFISQIIIMYIMYY